MAHSGASGYYHSGTSRYTRGLPEGLASSALGARGLLRKTPKKVPAKASKGALGRASRRLRKDSGHAACSEGLRKGGCFEVAVEGAFGEIFERVFEKGCEGVFEGGCEGVFRRMQKGSSGGFPRGAAMTVGSKIYGSGRSASSDRPNILAVPGRPIGDQRRACVGVFLLPGVSGRADARRRRRDMPAARPANSNRSARDKTERGSCGESKGRSAWSGDHRGKGPAARTVAEARRPSWRWRLQWTGSMGYYPRSTREVRGIFTLGRNDRTATAALGRRRT